MKRKEFMKLAAERGLEIRRLRGEGQASKSMEALRAEGYVVKRQEVKAWFGNQSQATDTLNEWSQ